MSDPIADGGDGWPDGRPERVGDDGTTTAGDDGATTAGDDGATTATDGGTVDDRGAGGEPGDGAGSVVRRSRNTFLGDCWTNFKRWNIKAVRNPFILVVSLAQPVIFLLLFSEVFGQIAGGAINRPGGVGGAGAGGAGISYETFLVPAIAIQVALAAAITSGIGLVNDIEEGLFEKILATPMSRTAVFAGKTAAEAMRILVQITIILGLGLLIGAEIATGVAGALGIALIGLLFSLWFLALSNAVAVLTKDQESTIIAMNLLQFPLLFLSSAFLPLDALPEWIQTFARFNPVTYGVDAARAIMLDRDVMTVLEVTRFEGLWNTLVPAIVVLVALDLLLGAIAVALLTRATSSDVK